MNMQRQKGVTLIELMIGLTISLIITAVIATLYLNSTKVFKVEDAVSRLQESGRFVTQTLQQDIRMAGFRGCEGATNKPVNTLNSATGYLYQFDTGVDGFNGASGSTWVPALDPSIAALVPAPLAGTDVLTIRKTVGGAFGVTAPFMGGNAAALHVESGNSLAKGDILLISNCSNSAIIQVTNANPNTSGDIVHAIGGTTVPGNATPDMKHVFKSDASIYRIVTRTYFIAPSVVRPGVNSLWSNSVPSYTGVAQPEELAEGIDNMQIKYGVDTDGDKAANTYLDASLLTAVDWANVVSVKLSLLMSTTSDNVSVGNQTYAFNGGAPITATDKKLHSSVSTVIALRNRTP